MRRDGITLVAEIGSIHDGSFGNALRAIDAVAGCGVDVVKFQTHIPEAETLRDAPSPSYFSEESRFDYFQRTSFTEKQWARLLEHCESVGISFMSSVFSEESLSLLLGIGVKKVKIPSGEVTNLPLLHKVASSSADIFLSTGMSNWKEIDDAVQTLRGCSGLTIMQCRSEYPCPPERFGINVIEALRRKYSSPIGFSDHSSGFVAAVLAVGAGATVIEKHFTFSKLMYGSDAALGMEPRDFRLLREMIDEAYLAISSPVDKDSVDDVSEMRKVFQKSIVAARRILAGEVLGYQDLTFKKPGTGISPGEVNAVIGRVARRNIEVDNILRLEDLE